MSGKHSRASPPSPFRPDLLKDQVALVTGGGSGIGLELAHQLGLHGARVVLMGRRVDVLTKAVQWLQSEKVEATHASGDVRKDEDCTKAVELCVSRFGRLDILVNCAAGKSVAAATVGRCRARGEGRCADACGCVRCVARVAFCALRRI